MGLTGHLLQIPCARPWLKLILATDTRIQSLYIYVKYTHIYNLIYIIYKYILYTYYIYTYNFPAKISPFNFPLREESVSGGRPPQHSSMETHHVLLILRERGGGWGGDGHSSFWFFLI